MPELVVPGAAQGVAVAPVVVRRADHPVLVLQADAAQPSVLPSGPLAAGVKLVLGGQAADQGVASWKKQRIRTLVWRMKLSFFRESWERVGRPFPMLY